MISISFSTDKRSLRFMRAAAILSGLALPMTADAQLTVPPSAIEIAPEALFWSAGEVTKELARCTQLLRGLDIVARPMQPIKDHDCGTPAPVELISVGRSPQVSFSPPVTVTCDLAAALHRWVKADLQPLARKHLGAEIVRIDTMSSYSCRTAYNRRNTKLSEHGRANAVDIRAFMTAKGASSEVLADWGMTGREVADTFTSTRNTYLKFSGRINHALADQVPFETRAQRTRSYVAVMRSLWCDEVSSHDDEYYTLPPCRQYPKPIQTPHPPIHFGGESDAALRRAADIGQGWFGFGLTPERAAERITRLRSLLAERGRDASEVQITVGPGPGPVDLDTAKHYSEAGADQLVVSCVTATADAYFESIRALSTDLVAPCADL